MQTFFEKIIFFYYISIMSCPEGVFLCILALGWPSNELFLRSFEGFFGLITALAPSGRCLNPYSLCSCR